MHTKSDLVRDIEHEVEAIVEAEDKSFEDRLNDYDYCIGDDPDEVLRNFRENYNSRSIGITAFDELDGAEVLDAFKHLGLKPEAIASLILDCSEPETCDIYIQWNEVASVQIGEMEYQIDVEDCALKPLVAQATDEELKQAGIKRDSFLAYGNPCDRIVWKVSPELVLERLAQMSSVSETLETV